MRKQQNQLEQAPEHRLRRRGSVGSADTIRRNAVNLTHLGTSYEQYEEHSGID